jgi:bifunctional DNA-binding transcriptional regulator/antitoxin component of YhaV-PrlF toxin-antitoxin module
MIGYKTVTKLALSEVSFGAVTIQRLRRITLDTNLLRTLGLNEGDSLEVVLIVDSSEIVLRKGKTGQTKKSQPGSKT